MKTLIPFALFAVLPVCAMDGKQDDFILVIAQADAINAEQTQSRLNSSPEDDVAPLLAGVKRSDSYRSDSSCDCSSSQVEQLQQKNEYLMKLSSDLQLDDIGKHDLAQLIRINSDEIVKHQDPNGYYLQLLERVRKIKSYETINDDDSQTSGDSDTSEDYDKVTLTVNQHTELLELVPLMVECVKQVVAQHKSEMDSYKDRLCWQEEAIAHLQQNVADLKKKLSKEKFQ